MIIKLCYNTEIHRVSQQPTSFKALNDAVKNVFGRALPPVYALQYDDTDGDKVMISNEEDYKAMLQTAMPSSTKSIKVYVVSLDESVISLQREPSVISKADSSENYQVINTSRSIEIQETREVSTPQEKSLSIIQIKPETPCIKVCEEKCVGEDSEILKCKKSRKLWHAKKKEKIQKMIDNSLYDNIPNIALLVKEFLSESNSQLSTSVQTEKIIEVPKPTHFRITCDGCGVKPIVGVRYKCAVCEDFDFCENCEAKINHPHPFLKIKDPRHHPRAIFAVFDENVPEAFNPNVFNQPKKDESRPFATLLAEQYEKIIPQETRNTISNVFSGLPEKVLGKFFVEKKEVKVDFPKESENVEVLKDEVPKVEQKKYDFAFVKEVSTIPNKISIKDMVIYKTITLKNTGASEWPKSTQLMPVNEIKGQQAKLINLAPGKEMSAILIIDSPCQSGNFISAWRMGYNDEKGKVQFIGEPFSVEFSIPEPLELKPEIKKEEPKKEEVSKEAVQDYPQKVKDLAKEMLEIFPEADYNVLLDFINNAPNLTLTDLIENYLG